MRTADALAGEPPVAPKRGKTLMSDWILNLTLLALEAANQEGEKGAQPGGGIEQMLGTLFPFLMIGLIFYLFMLRPGQRERAQRDVLLKALKKNDRVVTIGGIIGTIANIEPDGREVTVKVDDNTRIRFLRTSIQTVLTDHKEDESSKKEAKST